MKRARRIRRYLDRQQPHMVDLLKRLILVETPSLEPTTQKGAFNLLAAALREIGYRVREIQGRKSGGMLLARPDPRNKSQPLQLLLGHTDTVWPTGTLLRMPMQEQGNRISGPGAFDMKAGLVQMVFALKALSCLQMQPSATPVVLITSDEEIGSGDSEKWIRRLSRGSNRVFVLEPPLGERGHLKTIRKGVGLFRITAKGRAAHSGLAPEAGASAILELSHVIQKLAALNSPRSGITVNVGLVRGGLRPNVVAPEACATVDVRVLRLQDIETVEHAIHHLEPETRNVELHVRGRISRAPLAKTPRNDFLWKRAQIAAGKLGLELEQATAGGASDGNITSQYTATLDGLGAVGDGAHAQHEFVYADRLPERTALLALLLLDPPVPREVLKSQN